IKSFGNHSIDAILGTSQERYWDETTTQGQQGFPDDKTWVFDRDRGNNVLSNGLGASENAMVSFFGRVQYGYADRYLFSASLRRDGSSKFGANNRWGWFPALSAAWRIDQESFVQDVSWLSTARLRLSWGQAGNDRIGNANFLSRMQPLNYPLGAGQTMHSGFVVGNISNSKLGWEKSDSYNLGMDFGIWQDRITFNADVYYKRTTDLL